MYSSCFYAYNKKFEIFRSSPVKCIKGQNVDTKFKKCLCRYGAYRVHPKIEYVNTSFAELITDGDVERASEDCV